MITPEQHAEIRRLYFGEHWKVGTIVTNLGVHPDTVRAAIALDTRVVRRGACRRSILDPYLPFIRDTLAQYPRLRATRLYEMLRPRGYSGSANQLRRLVRVLRPQVNVALYRRLVVLPAEEAQVDWGAFGSIRIGHGTRALSGFVMVLSYSRALFAHFSLDQTLESFLRGHVEAFQVFGGSARTLVLPLTKKRGNLNRGRCPCRAIASAPSTTRTVVALASSVSGRRMCVWGIE